MSGKLKEEADIGSDGQLAAAIRDSANQIWLAGLGAFVKAQREGSKMFDSLVKEGEEVQNRAKKAADAQVADMRSKAAGTWDKLEQVFESRVERALHTLNVPTKKDIESLSKRVAELTAVTRKLSDSVGAPEAGAPRASAKKSIAASRTHHGAA